jgi:hypothetical protein
VQEGGLGRGYVGAGFVVGGPARDVGEEGPDLCRG